MPDALPDFLPTQAEELKRLGIDQLDVLLITGDAHVDHPAFPANLLGRWLEAFGFRVGLVARPRPDHPEDLQVMGPPRLFVGITAGALDSLVANRTALGKKRSDDAYAPGGQAGGRPDRALTAYGQLTRRAFGKSVLIVAGGLEASLRRFGHYDFWSDKIRRSVLMDCGADLLVHGMGEGPILGLAQRLADMETQDRQERLTNLRDLPGLVYRLPRSTPEPESGTALPNFEEVASDMGRYAESFKLQERHRHDRMWQDVAGMRVVANAPHAPLTQSEMDKLYGLPFRREAHPMYGDKAVPALEQVRFSVTSHRGCAGGCAFCAITSHQGLRISSRSEASVLAEIERMVRHPAFRGTVNDVGGPTANMYGVQCKGPAKCQRSSCLWPKTCPNLEVPQKAYSKLLSRARATAKIKHLFVTTGIRTDLLKGQPGLLAALVRHHTSGHFKVAPEHLDEGVLRHMRKPTAQSFLDLHRDFTPLSAKAGKRQYLLPYFMAAHPGCRLEDMLEPALFLRRHNIRAEQVQIFTPTPGTAATVMYASGIDPATG
ncbi:MAG: YgiQ family radical SAM protein, partial [Deltaproteobacteria bacterium]|nr:YgiQ family radical SAM protein [Deltaproteobacteria bacterium]